MTTRHKCPAGLRHALLAGAALSGIMLGSVDAEAKVGVAAAVNTDARGKVPGGQQQVITLGQSVIFNEEIATDAKGLVQVLLLDGTTFTVGPNSRLKIDEFVYNPDTGDARVVASLTKGTLRFIGGQTSRKPGGATIKTPVGTIGIRGAMVECSVDTKSSALFSMIFGNEVRFTGAGGERAKIFKPGFTLVVTGGAGGVNTTVRPRTQGDASTFQSWLAGTTGQSGGASQSPDDQSVEQSGVDETNSDLPGTAGIPTPRPSPVTATKIEEVEQSVAEIDIFTQEELRQQVLDDISPPFDDDDDDDGDDDGTPPVEPPVQTIDVRVLKAPQTYTSYGESFSDAGERGLVGSTAETDRNFTLAKKNGRLVSSADGIDLPDITGRIGDDRLVRVDVTSGVSPDGPLRGPGYAGAGDFAAYLLGVDGDPTRPFYVITGTGTPQTALDRLFTGNQVRKYTLTQDPIRPSPVPFFAPDVFGSLSNYNSSNLYIVEAGAPTPGAGGTSAKMYQSWIDIEGDGMDQKSGIGMLVADIAPGSTGDLAVATGRRGSFRAYALLGPANMRGGLGTLAGPDGSHFFGPDADNFVLGPSLSPADGFVDAYQGWSPITGEDDDGYLGDGFFGTHHVADLVGTTGQIDLNRKTRLVAGFMTGLGESNAEYEPFVLASQYGTNFWLDIDKKANSVGARGQVYDVGATSTVVDSFILTFGATEDAGGASAFVDDNRFAALQNFDNENTRLLTNGEQDIANLAGDNPGSYIVSGRANPIAGYEHCTSCDFIDWGWWGTRVTVGPDDDEIEETRQDFVHMGTWVAGDITNPADLPNNITATYSGTALGTVARPFGEGGFAKYIARGDMNMSFDFNTREGNLAITNFDGMNLSGSVNETSSDTEALFGGDIEGSGTSGYVRGAFVNDGEVPAAGVIGDFNVSGEDVRAVGTIAGRRAQ